MTAEIIDFPVKCVAAFTCSVLLCNAPAIITVESYYIDIAPHPLAGKSAGFKHFCAECAPHFVKYYGH